MELLEKKKKNMTRPGSKPTIMTALPQDHKILYEMLAKILILKDKCFHQIEPKYNNTLPSITTRGLIKYMIN